MSVGFMTCSAVASEVKQWALSLPSLRDMGIGDVFILCWIALGFVVWSCWFYAILFEVFGTEELTLERDHLQVSRGIGPIRQRRRLATRGLGIRVFSSDDPRVLGLSLGPSRHGRLKIEGATQEIRIGDALSAQEAEWLAEFLRTRLRSV